MERHQHLTPVKIRGKKNRATPRSGTPDSLLTKKRRPGRPLSGTPTPASSVASSRSSTPFDAASIASSNTTVSLLTRKRTTGGEQTVGAARRKRARMHGGTSRLERLPVEILQMIFLESENVELPLASRVLGEKLSSEHVKMDFCLRALLKLEEWERNSRDGTAELQSKLLQRKFFTGDWFRKYADRALRSKRYTKWVTEYVAEQRRLGRPEFQDPGLLQEEYGEGIFTCHALPFDSYFKRDIPDWQRLFPIYITPHHDTKIPEKLLAGPWDESKTAFLRILVWQELSIDTEHSSSIETLRHGLFDAFRMHNWPAAYALIWLARSKAEDTPTTELLRCAVIEGGCPENEVEALLVWVEEKGDIDCYDPAIWAWMAEREGSEKARWLKDRLLEADEGISSRKQAERQREV